MTVNTTNITSGPYIGNGLSDQYSYDFRVKNKTQLNVYETTDAGVRTLLTVDTDYIVAGIGDAVGGIITRVAGNLPTDYIWYIRSNYIENQLTAFNSQGGFFPGVHEDQFDHLTFLIQQILDTRNRSFRLSDEVDLDGDFTIDDDAVTRASKFLGFDSNGDVVVIAGDLDSLSVSAYMATVILAANAAAARVLLDAANLTVGNTFTAAQIYDAIATFNDVVTFNAANVFNALNTFNEKVVFNKVMHQQIGSNVVSAAALPNITNGNYAHVTAIAAAITGATQANPVVITAVDHGLSNGDKVTLADVAGMTEINGIEYTIANKTDDTFELSGINGTGFTAYTSGGSIWASIISLITTGEVGTIIYREFDGVLMLTHHATNLILFNNEDIITQQGDVATLLEYVTGDFKLIDYTRVDGTSLIKLSGSMVQFVEVTENTGSSGTTAIPDDNTIPQNTEGDEVMTLAITPTNASNNLIIDVYIGMMDSPISSNPAIALFQDSIVDALSVSKVITSSVGLTQGGTLKYIMPAGTTSEIIFKVRIGLTAGGTLYFNRNNTGELFGIASRSYITITEVKA